MTQLQSYIFVNEFENVIDFYNEINKVGFFSTLCYLMKYVLCPINQSISFYLQAYIDYVLVALETGKSVPQPHALISVLGYPLESAVSQ